MEKKDIEIIEERLTELENKVTYQDHIIDDLNKVVIELRAEVDAVKKENKEAFELLGSLDLKDSSQEVPPPHY